MLRRAVTERSGPPYRDYLHDDGEEPPDGPEHAGWFSHEPPPGTEHPAGDAAEAPGAEPGTGER